jgi:hypothetical protein
VAAAAVGIALTACSSPMHAGAAAVVGNERITMNELNADTESYRGVLKKLQVDETQVFGGVPVSHVVLRRLVDMSAASQLLKRYNVQVSETEVDTVLKDPGQYQSADINLAAAGVAPSFAREYGRITAGVGKLQQQVGQSGLPKLNQEYTAIKQVFNPRFGALNQQPSQQNPGLFVDAGRFGKLTTQPQQPPQQQG